MTPEEKQSELNRYKDLVLATLNYLREQYAGSIVLDQVDHIADYYRQQESQTEKYYKQRKLDRLQKQFRRLTKGIENRTDFNFGSHISRKWRSEYSEEISKVEKGGVEEVTVRISKGPKPKHLEEQGAISPDGKCRLRVTQWSDGKNASTYVVIEFSTASGAVYGTNGIHPDVKATWKDNSTVVIVTQKNYIANTQHREIRSFDDVITIEYIER